MSYAMDTPIALRASESARASFIRRTYAHLAGAILAFAAIEFAIFGLIPRVDLDNFMIRYLTSGMSFLVVFVGFIGVGWLARMWANSDTAPAVQYLGLALYVILEAIIFVPLLWFAQTFVKDPNLIPTAGVMTLAIFAGLTMAVFTTGKDFSFLGPILSMCTFLALGFIVAAIIFGFTLGLVFSFAMVALACGFILYDTSNVLHHFRTDQHVAASLELFASVAFLFYQILWILIQLSGRGGD